MTAPIIISVSTKCADPVPSNVAKPASSLPPIVEEKLTEAGKQLSQIMNEMPQSISATPAPLTPERPEISKIAPIPAPIKCADPVPSKTTPLLLPKVEEKLTEIGKQLSQTMNEMPQSISATSAPLTPERTGISKIAYNILFGFRCALTGIAILGLIINVALAFPVTVLITLVKSLYYLVRGQPKEAAEVWKSWARGTILMIKNSTTRSIEAAQTLKDPNAKIATWLPELLCIMIDCNGELRNGLSVANATSALNSHDLGVTLGPFRVVQGLLVAAFSIVKLVEQIKKLKAKGLSEIEKREIKIAIASYSTYLAVGALWIGMGTLQIIITVLCAGAPPLWLGLLMAVVTFALFDIGFISMSAFYIAQSVFIKNHYIKPSEEFLKNFKSELKTYETDKTLNTLQAIETKLKKTLGRDPQQQKLYLQLIALRKSLSTELQDKLFNCEIDKIADHVQKIRVELDRHLAFHHYLNIGLNAVTQMGISLAGTPWDTDALIFKADHAPDSPLVDATQGGLWVDQNTVSKFGDDSGIGKGLTGVGCSEEDEKRVQSTLKTYTVAILAMMASALIATDIAAGPILDGHSQPFFELIPN